MAKNPHVSMSFDPRLRAVAQMNDQSGVVGRATRNAAETTKKRFQGSVNRFGRVDTGQSRDKAKVTFRGSNQFETRFSVEPGSSWWIFQERGTRSGIRPAPSLQNAINKLRPSDFHQ